MSPEANEVVVAGSGHIYRSPIGTAFPTDISVAVNDALWTELGYTTPEGVKFTFGRDTTDIMAWQSFDPLRTIINGVPKEIAATFLQFNQNTWATAMGGGTWTGTTGKWVYSPPAADYLDQFQLMVEFTDGSISYRYCYRNVMNAGALEMTTNREGAIELPVSMKVLAAPTAGQDAWFIQTSDPDLGDYAQAGS